MWFLETSFFTRQISSLLSGEEYRQLQRTIILRPEQGSLIPGSNGLRKIRCAQGGRGKRGGCRVIYYWDVKSEGFFMLLAYPKTEKDDLTRSELKDLRSLVKEEFK